MKKPKFAMYIASEVESVRYAFENLVFAAAVLWIGCSGAGYANVGRKAPVMRRARGRGGGALPAICWFRLAGGSGRMDRQPGR